MAVAGAALAVGWDGVFVGICGWEVCMRFRDWVWVYLGMGESFTRWAVLLFYGAVWGAGVVVVGLVAVLALAMAVHRG